MEFGAGALIIVFALVVLFGLGMATRPRKAVARPGARRPRLAVRLRRRRRRVADRVRTGWYSATTWSTGSDGNTAGSSGYESSSSYDSGGGGGDIGGGGGGGGSD